MFQEKMVTPAIPERVYALCKMVEKGAMAESELRERLQPEYLGKNTPYFADYRNAAEELKLITTNDNMIELAVEPSVIKTIGSMRKYINSIIAQFKDGQFYRVTKEYYAKESSVLRGETSLAELAPEMSQKTGMPVDAPAMRAWRFWAPFLGFGYLHDMFLIPNADVFLKDIIQVVGFERDTVYSFGEFIYRISPYAQIILNDDPANRMISFGVSNGLRTLHDSGFIKMDHVMDQEDIWSLYEMNAHPIRSTVTNITICQ